jgi:hypothetical protein
MQDGGWFAKGWPTRPGNSDCPDQIGRLPVHRAARMPPPGHRLRHFRQVDTSSERVSLISFSTCHDAPWLQPVPLPVVMEATAVTNPAQAAVEFIRSYRQQNPGASKEAVAEAAAEAFHLVKHRKVYACDDYAIRFSSASGESFSNTVLGLGQLQQFDDRPFVVVVCRPHSTEFLLANTTFLKKISHSSHQLRIDNIRGSFLGHDIVREYDGISNEAENFDQLYACHQEFTWEENIERLVEATNAISGTGRRFEPTKSQLETILAAPALAANLSQRACYGQFKEQLRSIVREKADQILTIARDYPTNVNLRGNKIEQTITGGMNEHHLGDMIRRIDDNISVEIEIKSKLMNRSSSPKAYNIDKALQTLSRPGTLIVFCFVGVDLDAAKVTSSTVSILGREVLDATRVQFHWAGRNSRGVTQLAGDFDQLFQDGYREHIDTDRAVHFLKGLLSR